MSKTLGTIIFFLRLSNIALKYNCKRCALLNLHGYSNGKYWTVHCILKERLFMINLSLSLIVINK